MASALHVRGQTLTSTSLEKPEPCQSATVEATKYNYCAWEHSFQEQNYLEAKFHFQVPSAH